VQCFFLSCPSCPSRSYSMFPKGISHVCSSCSQKRFLWHVYVPHVPKRGSSGMSVFLMFPKEGSPCLVLTFFHVLFKAIYSHVPKRDCSGMSVFLMFPKRGFSMSGPHFLSCASQSYLFSCSVRVPSCSAPSCSFSKCILMFLKGVPFSLCFFMFFHVLLGVILMFPEGSSFYVPS